MEHKYDLKENNIRSGNDIIIPKESSKNGNKNKIHKYWPVGAGLFGVPLLFLASAGVKKLFYTNDSRNARNDFKDYYYGHLSNENLLNYIKEPQLNQDIINIVSKYKGQFGALYSAPDWIMYNQVKKNISDIIDKGNLPIRYVKMADLNSLNLKPNGKARFFRTKMEDCWNIHKKSYNDNSIAIVCSQYNALESVVPYPNPIENWYSDNSQGPTLALRAPVDVLHKR